jgi:integrase
MSRYLDHLPVRIAQVQVRRPEVKPFTPDEARLFLEVIRGDRLEALYSVALAVGLRQGEALGLRWGDIDLNSGTLRVRSALQWLYGKPHFVEPKTERSRRSIALPRVAIDALRPHRTRQFEERLIAGSSWQEHGLVFATTVGSPIHPRNLVRHFHRTLEKAGLPKKRFHDLRHTCASLLLAQGVQPRVVMEILGHSQISLTMDTYSHVIPALTREAANHMDAILGIEK